MTCKDLCVKPLRHDSYGVSRTPAPIREIDREKDRPQGNHSRHLLRTMTAQFTCRIVSLPALRNSSELWGIRRRNNPRLRFLALSVWKAVCFAERRLGQDALVANVCKGCAPREVLQQR
jgi:hypothetical protein